MNREIEFRCWYYNQMHKVSNIDFRHNQINLFASDTIPIENGILMQYTGLKDKNGKKIFEGDIVEYKDFDLPIRNKTGKIVYTQRCMFEIEYYEDILKRMDTIPLVCLEHPIFTPKKLEVIGNIYENNLENKGE